ncbi:unnamed protein product [Camellia sinensis]
MKQWRKLKGLPKKMGWRVLEKLRKICMWRSGKSTDQEGMIEDLKNVHTRAMSSSAKEFEEEEILKDTNEG